ncbi:MAG: hypothetical protein WC325_10795, partial [Candidatus Bathyarchaeia archaeon]
MRNLRRSKRGQFSVIAALLVSVILIMAVISMYSMVRYTPLNDSPQVLTGVGEMNNDLKRILDFTVGYYGSVVQITGNYEYAQNMTTNYLSSGLVNIARSHPEWNPSFELDFEDISTRWFMPYSYSMGSINVTYSLGAFGIEGITYYTSSALSVKMLNSPNPNYALINVTRDNSEPELGLSKDNFWFYNYNYDDSTWELVNPDTVSITNELYNITIPDGINQDAYSVQIEDNRGIIVPAFYSAGSVTSEIPHYTYTFNWNSTGMIDIYNSLVTDTFAIELLQNGTLNWLGQPLELSFTEQPIPPVCIKAFHVNATIDDNNQEVPFQVEDWASDYMVPLGLASNESIFSNTNMLIFLVNNHISEVTVWWDGNDAATQTPYAQQNNFNGDVHDTYHLSLSNGKININVNIDDSRLAVTSTAGYASSKAEFLRINGDRPVFHAGTSCVIYNGSVRAILQQEPEYSGGGATDLYSQLIFTLPVNTTYYTYTARTIFVDTTQYRTVNDLSVIQLSDLSGSSLTEDGTSGGYPETSDSNGLFYDGSPSGWAHHWSQISSGVFGAGVMFNDDSNENLYIFDDVQKSGALNVQSSRIEVNPVDSILHSVSFQTSKDIVWYGAVVTFSGEPIYPLSGHNGLWVMVEHPPKVSLDSFEGTSPETTYYEDYANYDLSNVDSMVNKGSQSNFVALQGEPDSVYDNLTEAMSGTRILDYVDISTSDVDGSANIGTHSSFPAEQSGPNSVYDTLTEASTASNSNTTLLDDGFEGSTWNANWNDVSSSWQRDTNPVHSGSASAWATNYHEGTFTSDNLNANGASAIYVDFWFSKTGLTQGNDQNDFTLYYYDGSNYDLIDELARVGGDGTWEHYVAKITDSQYFISNFRIRFDATLGNGENVWVDDVVILKEVQSANNYKLDLEVQFTNAINFLSTNELCIYTGSLGAEDLHVSYWTGSVWQSLATDLTANSWNNFTVPITSTSFTVRFSGGSETSDTSADQWQIDVVLLDSHGSGSQENAVVNDTSNVDSSSDLGALNNFDNMKTRDSTYATLTESGPGSGITYVNVADSTATSGTLAQINKPAGTIQNDFMMALLVSTISNDAGTSMVVAPTGWTLLTDYTQETYSGQHVYIYWKIAGASEPSSYTWTWASSCGWVAQITTFRGVDTASPINVAGTVQQESSSSPTSPSITTSASNCMIWLYDMCDGNV